MLAFEFLCLDHVGVGDADAASSFTLIRDSAPICSTRATDPASVPALSGAVMAMAAGRIPSVAAPLARPCRAAGRSSITPPTRRLVAEAACASSRFIGGGR